MDEERALVRVQRSSWADELGEAFFRDAYRAFRERADEARLASDQERITACLLHVAQKSGLDPTSPDGLAAAEAEVGAALALGLAEAAEDDPTRAIALLERSDIDRFFELGYALYRELRSPAVALINQCCVTVKGRIFGLLDLADERALIEAAKATVRYARSSDYHAAREAVERSRLFLQLASLFPLEFALADNCPYTRFHQGAFARLDRATPSNRGGVLALFVRSYLVKVLASDPVLFPVNAWQRGIEFLNENFLISAEQLQALVADTFFEPAAVAAKLPGVLTAFDRYLTQPLNFVDRLSFTKPLITARAVREAARNYARQQLEEFVRAVRAYYRSASEVEISTAALNAFWGSWVLAYSVSKVDEHTLAAYAGSDDVRPLLRVKPRRLEPYLTGVAHWSAGVRETFIQQYPWHRLLRTGDLTEDERGRLFGTACDHLGSSVMQQFRDARRMPMAFWLRLWERGSPALRDGILELFRQNAPVVRYTFRSFREALEEFGSCGSDLRLLAWALRNAAGSDDPAATIELGMTIGGWAGLLLAVRREPDAIRIVWRRMPQRLHRPVLNRLAPSVAEAIIRILERSHDLL